MSKLLPTHSFRWMTEEELMDWRNHPCILEVDLKYPHHLHDLYNDYPLALEILNVDGVDKLKPNLHDKKKYVVHHEALKLYEVRGLVVTKIHRGITFEESTWLKPYIDLNTKLRAKATNDFEKNFFKLMNNSVFGKTMENIRKRVQIDLVNSEAKARKLICQPNFNGYTIFCENLVALHMKKTHLVINKPVYLGISILDLSKTLMYRFHYDYIKSMYDEKSKLLFTDTDSLMYEIETKDFHKDISPDVREMLDTSEYPEDHPSGIEVGVNKKVLGMFKVEVHGKQIDKFFGLRAKLYAYKMDEKRTVEGVEKDIVEKRCKGINKVVTKNNITFDDYKNCLFNQKPQRRKMNVIRLYKHDVFSETINKVALSNEDGKWIIREDGIHTYAHGHFRMKSGGNSVSSGAT